MWPQTPNRQSDKWHDPRQLSHFSRSALCSSAVGHAARERS